MNMSEMYRELAAFPAWIDLQARLEKNIKSEIDSFFDTEDRADAEEFRVRIKIKKEFLTEINTIIANTILTKDGRKHHAEQISAS